MKQVNVKKLILPNIPYVFIALLATKVSEAVRLAPGSDASAKLLNIMTGLNTAFHSLVPSFHPIDLSLWALSPPSPFGWRSISRAKTQRNSAKSGVRQRPLGNRRGHQALRRSRVENTSFSRRRSG